MPLGPGDHDPCKPFAQKCLITRDMSCQPPGSPQPTLHFDPRLPCCPQHASADVEKMILGNKCDVNDKRQVSKERGEKVGAAWAP